MFARIVSLALIAAVIACPLWCGNGICRAGHCCAADACCLGEQTSDAVCLVHKTTDCCCGNASPGSGQHPPRQYPQKSSCQGVCGGAVLEKPCELEDLRSACLLPLIDTGRSVGSLLAGFRTFDVEHQHRLRSNNHGRFVRTMHSSFLC